METIPVRISTSISGHAMPQYEIEDFSFYPGQIVDLPLILAAAWVESGLADYFDDYEDYEVAGGEQA